MFPDAERNVRASGWIREHAALELAKIELAGGHVREARSTLQALHDLDPTSEKLNREIAGVLRQ